MAIVARGFPRTATGVGLAGYWGSHPPFPWLKRVLTAVFAVVALAAVPAPALASKGQLSIFQDDFVLRGSGNDARTAALNELDGLGVDVVKVAAMWRALAPGGNTEARRLRRREPGRLLGDRLGAVRRPHPRRTGARDARDAHARRPGARLGIQAGGRSPGRSARTSASSASSSRRSARATRARTRRAASATRPARAAGRSRTSRCRCPHRHRPLRRGPAFRASTSGRPGTSPTWATGSRRSTSRAARTRRITTAGSRTRPTPACRRAAMAAIRS